MLVTISNNTSGEYKRLPSFFTGKEGNIILDRIQEIAKEHGLLISYDIINQINNGEGKYVKKGLTPKFTFTVYVTNEDGDEIDMESHNTLEDALMRGIKIAEGEINR